MNWFRYDNGLRLERVKLLYHMVSGTSFGMLTKEAICVWIYLGSCLFDNIVPPWDNKFCSAPTFFDGNEVPPRVGFFVGFGFRIANA